MPLAPEGALWAVLYGDPAVPDHLCPDAGVFPLHPWACTPMTDRWICRQ